MAAVFAYNDGYTSNGEKVIRCSYIGGSGSADTAERVTYASIPDEE